MMAGLVIYILGETQWAVIIMNRLTMQWLGHVGHSTRRRYSRKLNTGRSWGMDWTFEGGSILSGVEY
jgi:hypothetical protein